ncbi:MAG TPA: SRPBCC domain-containing protein [bacterium]|jgi:uncharacterized protein YndB with AHSA1/START domain|nr:SRPBCC domain-containing protein [bacterium]
MSQTKTLSVDVKRVIAGSPAKVFEAWLDPKQPCNPWNYGKTAAFEAKVGRVFCILMGSAGAHFGRFLKLAKGRQLQYTWMSRYTRGMESTVTMQFKKHAAGTLVTLRHSGLPNDEGGRGHEGGWGQFLEMLEAHFSGKK